MGKACRPNRQELLRFDYGFPAGSQLVQALQHGRDRANDQGSAAGYPNSAAGRSIVCCRRRRKAAATAPSMTWWSAVRLNVISGT